MATNRPGDLLAGRYRLDDLMSESGSGQFWRGFDTVLARDVAIHAIDVQDPRSLALLVAARASAHVVESRFLRVLDIDTVDGLTFVVNEWGSGTSFDNLLARGGPLSPRRAAWVVDEVAAALTVAHEAGIAHGRLNPENVLIDDAGSVRIIGFAVEAALHGLGGDRVPIDITDLAALLQAALTGRWAGITESAVPRAPREHATILERGRERVLSPRQIQAGVPTVLDELCDEVINRPHGRHAGLHTAREIHEVLAAYVGDPGDVEEEVAAAAQASALLVATAGTRVDPERTGPLERTDFPTELGTPIFDESGDVSWFTPRENHPVATVPPLEPLPERPLFTPDGERWATPPSRSDVAPSWVLSAPSGVEEDRPPGSGWLRLAAALGVIVLLVTAAVTAFALTRSNDGATPRTTPTTSSAAPTPATIPGVTALDFDPEGDAPFTEFRELAPLAVDGDPATSWHSYTYTQQFGPGGLKDGLGIVLDLQQSYAVTSLDLTFAKAGTSLSVYVTDEAPTAAPTEATEEAASLDEAGTQATVTLPEATSGRYVTVWFTALPQVKGGYRVQLAEASVAGTQP
ncbi:MAG: protein kinase family protein [Nocardioides sp.]|uniref:protein kinase family protein n=1 Tax=Nocardioides sp. TaxID=35761 RepID=UPI0039E21AC2